LGSEKIPVPGRLIIGVLWNRDEDLETAEDRIEDIFGPVGSRSEKIPFGQYSSYYEKEMGKDIQRCLWSLNLPFQRGALVEAKLATNRIERSIAGSGNRTVNLDPGLLTLEGLSLATTKTYYHRLYLGKGVFGELTLIYRQGGFEPLPWSYPDYRDRWAVEFLEKVRGEMLEEWRRKIEV
jgi:hypothetical protein